MDGPSHETASDSSFDRCGPIGREHAVPTHERYPRNASMKRTRVPRRRAALLYMRPASQVRPTMDATVSVTARPTCQDGTSLAAIRTAMRMGANGGSSEHTVARGPVGFGSATYTSRYPTIWRIDMGAMAPWTSSWRETREATAE